MNFHPIYHFLLQAHTNALNLVLRICCTTYYCNTAHDTVLPHYEMGSLLSKGTGECAGLTGSHQPPGCSVMSSSRKPRNQLGVFQSPAAPAPAHTWGHKKRTEVKTSSISVLNYHGRVSMHLCNQHL